MTNSIHDRTAAAFLADAAKRADYAATQPRDDAACDAAIAAIEAGLIESGAIEAPVTVEVVQQGRVFVRSVVRASDGVSECVIPYDFARSLNANLDAGRKAFALRQSAPAMVPQQVQQQQACAAPLYAFQVRGEDARPVAPRTAQDVEGITSRSVVAQTVHVRTRADWYAFSRACRTVARTRVEERKAGESIFWAMIGGRVHRLSVERTSFGAMRTAAGAYRRVCHGTPVALATARLTQRPRRALIAAELDWAAKYRANAKRDVLHSHRRAMSIKAVRACIAEARGLWSAFDRLPG